MPGTKPAILLVEHDIPTRELYARALGRDYRVLARGDTLDVQRLLVTEDICAMVLEPALPDGEGWKLLAALHEAGTTGRLPVLLCSVFDGRKRGMQLGAQVYLVKPVLPVSLLEAVGKLVHRAGQQQ